MTRKRLFLPSILALIAIMAACSSPTSGGGGGGGTDPDPDPVTGTLAIPLPGGASPSMRLAAAVDIAEYSVSIVSIALGYNEARTGTPGSTITIESLSPGDYTVSVEALDASDNLLFTGSVTVSVTAGNTATATVTLMPSQGDLSVDIEIPADYVIPEMRLASIGFDRYKTTYTYNSDGVITRIDRSDYELDGNSDEYEVFSLNADGRRTGSQTYQYDIGTETYVLTDYTSVITLDTNGNETRIDYYIDSDLVEYVAATYNSEGTAITELKKYDSDGNLMFYNYFDELGRVIERGSTWIYGYSDVWEFNWGYTTDELTDVIKIVYEYYENTSLISGTEIYINGTLHTYTDLEISSSGLYIQGEQFTADGRLAHFYTYGAPQLYNGQYIQSETIYKVLDGYFDIINYSGYPANYENINNAVQSFYRITTDSFQDGGWLSWPREYEDGTKDSGVIMFTTF